MVTGIIFGLVPALRASSPDVVSALKQSARGAILAPSSRVRSLLVVAQVAMALVLLVGAGLMMRSFTRLMAIEPGFDPENVVTMRVTLPAAKYADRDRWIAFHEDLIRRVRTIPGVTAAGLNSALPLEGGAAESAIGVEGRPLPGPGTMPTMCVFQTITPGYHRSMGIRLLKGRFFTPLDQTRSAPVAIVDETLVSRLFPNEEPVGRRVGFEFSGSRDNPEIVWREIVGVVSNVKHYGLTSTAPYVQIYAPVTQLPTYFSPRRPSMAIVARTALASEAVTQRHPARGHGDRSRHSGLRDADHAGVSLTEHRAAPYEHGAADRPRRACARARRRRDLRCRVYSVAQRTQEIGVRMALGATGSHILRLVVGQASLLVVAGVILGIVGALGMASIVRTMLYQVSARDPLTFAAIALILTAVGVLASVVPARRAVRVDPIVALRDS